MKIKLLKTYAVLLILFYIFPSIKMCLLLPGSAEDVNAKISNISIITDGITKIHDYTYEFIAENGKKYSGAFREIFKDVRELKYGPYKIGDKIQIRYFLLLPSINTVNQFDVIEKKDILSVSIGFIIIFIIIFMRNNPFSLKWRIE